VPLVGDKHRDPACGARYSVGNPTLNASSRCTICWPFVIAGVVSAARSGPRCMSPARNNPAGVEAKDRKDTVPFTPYATIKDAFGVSCFMLGLRWSIFLHCPELSRRRDQLTSRQSRRPRRTSCPILVLPAVSTPILRSIPEQARGPRDRDVLAIIVLGSLPWLDNAKTACRSIVRLPSSSSGFFRDRLRAARPYLGAQAAGRHLRESPAAS